MSGGILVGGDVMGFSWSGVLGATDLAAVYLRCDALRLTGLLELVDGAKRAEVVFVGGEPVETRGGEEAEVRAWRRGSFHLTQRVPDLAGALTDGIRLEGELRHAPPRELIRNCQDTSLTAELALARRTGGKAELRFARGKVESVIVDGKADLGALGRIGGWLDGRYTLSLRPLFTDEAPAGQREKPRPEPGQLFDFTSQVVLPDAAPAPAPPVRERPAELLATLPIGNHGLPSVLPPPPEIPEEYSQPGLVLDDKTAITREARPSEADALTSMTRLPSPSERPRRAKRRARWAPMAAVGLVVFAAVAAATVLIVPRLAEAPPSPVETRSAAETPAEKVAPPARDERPPRAAPRVATAPSRLSDDERDSEELERIADARLAMVEGHARAALTALKAARRIAPHDTLLDALELMARGNTGHGEILVDGEGALTIDGHRFSAPARIKLPAGPHLIGDGAHPDELILRKGDQRHLSAR